MPYGVIPHKRTTKPKKKYVTPRKAIADDHVKAIVKNVLSRNEEVKVYRFVQNGSLYSPYNSMANAYSVSGDLWCASPHSSFCAITQGVGASERIGNKVMIKSVRLRANYYLTGYDVVNNLNPRPHYLKIWIFSIKHSNQLSDVQSVIFNNFMDSNNSSVGMSGQMQDLTAPVNKSYVTLKKVLIRKLGNANYSGTGSTASGQYLANNDFHLTQYVDIELSSYLKRDVIYNDNSATSLTDLTWIFSEVIPFDNYTTGQTVVGAYNMCIETRYTDA